MRPIYETASDLSAEDGVSAALSKAWGIEMEKLPDLHTFDRAVKQGGVLKAFVEIKNRNKSYPTYLISLKKWRDMLRISDAAGVPAILAVCWPVNGERKIKVIRVNGAEFSVVQGGRKDRNDPRDMEDMVEIPISQFEDVV